MSIQNQLIELIRKADRAGANSLLTCWAADHGYARLFSDVLEPALLHIGEEWRATESFTLAQAYVAAKVAEDILVRISQETATSRDNLSAGAQKRTVVIGNIQEDFHALGRRMVGTFLRSKGWDVHDLGNDVTPAAFVDKAQEIGARVIGVSAMMLSTANNIRQLREEINSRGLAGRLQMAVGGAVFLINPNLVAEVGGDGTSPNAIASADLFEKLYNRASE